MNPAQMDQIIDAALHGDGSMEAEDLFWLMLWADWSVEKQLMEEQATSSAADQTG